MNQVDIKQSRQKILNALNQAIQPVPRSPGYGSGMFGAAAVLVFMVMAYFGMVTLLFWILLNLLCHMFTLGGAHHVTLFGFAVYSVMFIILGSVFLALVKPLLLRRSSAEFQFELHPKQEPFLFEYVQRVCQAVGSPPPSKILVDIHVNAAASFVSGPMDNRMSLRLGLPLILGLNTRQLTGIIAHEFGHFSQSGGMRLNYLVRSLEQWFTEAAFNRDAFDAKIAEYSETKPFPISWIFFFVRLAVWLARMALVLLTYCGHYFIAKLLREMEFDADRHEARMVGSQTFASTARMLARLGVSEQMTMDDLDHYRRTKRLPDNLPRLLVDNEKNIDNKKFRELEEEMLNVNTEWSDTHPCERERIENAAQENTPGVFQLELPASILLSDINSVCQIITLNIYREAFGQDFKPSEVKCTGDLIKTRNVSRSEDKAALRFALEQFCGYDTFLLPRPQLGQAMKSAEFQQATVQRREQLLQHVRGYAKIRQQEDNVWNDLAKATCAKRLIEAGFDLSTAGDTFTVRTLNEAVRKINQCTNQDRSLKSQLSSFRQILGLRLMDALEYMRSEQVATAAGEKPNVSEEIKHLLNVWNCVESLRPTFESFFFETRVSMNLLMASEGNLDDQTMRSIQSALSRLTNAMIKIQQSTVHLMYPFEHGLGQVSLSHYLIPELPRDRDVDATMSAAIDLDSNLEFLLKRCVARLGALAEKVETTFGFPPLETPAEIKQMAEESS